MQPDSGMIGLGTLLNVAAVLFGGVIGGLLRHRLPDRVRDVVMNGLGVVVLMIAALSASDVLDQSLSDATGDDAPVFIVLGAVVIGGTVGALIGIDRRVERLGALLHRRGSGQHQERFIEGFVSTSLVIAIGPVAILGALSDGLGNGIELLVTKSILDFVIVVAFAAAYGWGVVAAALPVLVVQGTFTVVGFMFGGILPEAHAAALSATGGLLLIGVALRVLDLKAFPTGDLLPAVILAPLLTELVIVVAG